MPCTLAQKNSARRNLNMTLDNIAQYRLRAQTAESYQLFRIAHQARATISRLETDIERLSAILEN